MSTKMQKKKDSGRQSASSKEGSASAKAEHKANARHQQLVVWPEWNDTDINQEKWYSIVMEESIHKGGAKEKGKSPSMQFFDDPDGLLDLPSTVKPVIWKRPQDFLYDRQPVIVEDPCTLKFDLLSANEHLDNCEVIRWIISQITALWRLNSICPNFVPELSAASFADFTTWKPWEHIYSLCKVGKTPHVPLYNPYGKYAVRLFWLGTWRKIMVDDSLPFDAEDRLLLPATSNPYELWPILLSKALIKVLSLDYSGGSYTSEFGDGSIIHCLTGWLPEPIPIMSSYVDQLWELLKKSVPEFKLPDPNEVKPVNTNSSSDGEPSVESTNNGKKEKFEEVQAKEAPKKPKDPKKDKDKPTESVKPDKPQVVVFCSYDNPPKLPKFVSRYAEISNLSERLRSCGLSHLMPHPLMVTRTRSCPLEPLPVPPPVPAWKLIRPRKKRVTPSDEAKVEEEPLPEQWIEISSPFINYKVYPIDVPKESARRQRSSSTGKSRAIATESVPEVDETFDVNEPSANDEKVSNAGSVDKEDLHSPSPKPHIPVSPVDFSAEETKRMTSKDTITSDRKFTKKTSKSNTQTSLKEMKLTSANLTSKHQNVASKIDSSDVPDGVKAESSGPEPIEPADVNKEQWLHWEDFKKCFKNIIVYHKPSSYSYREMLSDYKHGVTGTPSAVSAKKSAGDKGKGTSSPLINAEKETILNVRPHGSPLEFIKSTTRVTKIHSHFVDNLVQSGTDDRLSLFLSVDSLKPIELILNFSSLCGWLDPSPPPALPVENKEILNSAATTAKLVKEKSVVSEAPSIYSDHGATIRDDIEARKRAKLVPGILVAEPYSWKHLTTGNPLLNIKSTGVKAVMLCLNPGRHVLRFHVNAPLAWNLHIVSSTRFVFGDEENVMNSLLTESLRFQEYSVSLISKLGKFIQGFSDSEQRDPAFEELKESINPSPNLQDNIDVFRKAFYYTIGVLFADGISSDMIFALRCLTCDLRTESVVDIMAKKSDSRGKFSFLTLHVHVVEEPEPENRPQPTSKKESRRESKVVSTGRHSAVQNDAAQMTNKALETWKEKELTEEELESIMVIQSAWKGFYSRSIISAQQPGTTDNDKAKEQLMKIWQAFQPNSESAGLMLLRTMFRIDPDQIIRFPFSKDEWFKITFSDYSGNYPEQPPNTWFVVFRSIFYVDDLSLLVPKLSSTVNTCFLRVINNDTGEEVDKVFMRVAPHTYSRNQRGYTFLCEGRSSDYTLPAGKWRMRLIGCQQPLPTPTNDTITTNLHVREIKDYYVPNDHKIIYRYSVKVSEDHLATIQMQTSKLDVYILLEILDNEEKVASATGKGHAIIPAFVFLKDSSQSRQNFDKKRMKQRDGPSRSLSLEEKLRKISVPKKLLETSHKIFLRNSSMSKKGKATKIKSKRIPKAQELDAMSSRVKKAKRSISLSTLQNSPIRSNSKNVSNESPTASDVEIDAEQPIPHKYVIQAKVLRNSWPLSESHWHYALGLKEQEKEELKANFEPSRANSGKSTNSMPQMQKSGPNKRSLKSDRSNKVKDKSASRPTSQQFDFDKPHWLLRVVSDADAVNDIEVRRDTERCEQIRSLKLAWEAADPGRAEKAAERRAKFLETYSVKAEDDEDTNDTDEIQDVVSRDSPTKKKSDATESQMLNEPPDMGSNLPVLKPLDQNQYRIYGEPVVFVETEELEKERIQKQDEFTTWREVRSEMKKKRQDELACRNQCKVKQIELYEELQRNVDKLRQVVNQKFEDYRLEKQKELMDSNQNMVPETAVVEKPVVTPSKKGKGSAKGSKKGSAKGKKK